MSISGNEAQISLRVYPNASKNEMMGFTDEVLRVKISAPPIKGKARYLRHNSGVKASTQD